MSSFPVKRCPLSLQKEKIGKRSFIPCKSLSSHFIAPKCQLPVTVVFIGLTATHGWVPNFIHYISYFIASAEVWKAAGIWCNSSPCPWGTVRLPSLPPASPPPPTSICSTTAVLSSSVCCLLQTQLPEPRSLFSLLDYTEHKSSCKGTPNEFFKKKMLWFYSAPHSTAHSVVLYWAAILVNQCLSDIVVMNTSKPRRNLSDFPIQRGSSP